ncbi:MAG: hypothetical protein Q9162_006126 [Coniocarpon cinnabarinum]
MDAMVSDAHARGFTTHDTDFEARKGRGADADYADRISRRSGAETSAQPRKKRRKESRHSKTIVTDPKLSSSHCLTAGPSLRPEGDVERSTDNLVSSEKQRRKASRKAEKAALRDATAEEVRTANENSVHALNQDLTPGSRGEDVLLPGMSRVNDFEPAPAELTSVDLPSSIKTRGVESSANMEMPKQKGGKGQILAHDRRKMTDCNAAQVQHHPYIEHSQLTNLPQVEVDNFYRSASVNISDPTSFSLRPILDFCQLPSTHILCHDILKEFKRPMPIQSASWPFGFAGRDLVGVAETGSGKTLAFGLPLARYIRTRLDRDDNTTNVRRSPLALVLTPTRELAQQIYEQLSKLGTSNTFNCALAYGGVDKSEQLIGLRRAHVVVATPGRLKDYISMGKRDGVVLERCKYVVLDEADRMLDKGFEDDVKDILAACPKTQDGRQTLMYTATWPQSIQRLASTYMSDPVKIRLGDRAVEGAELRANESIVQTIMVMKPYEKQHELNMLLRKYTKGDKKRDRILIFCLYKKEAAKIEAYVRSLGYQVGGLHGDLNQSARSTALGAFRDGQVPLLVATDVAARGLDIPSVKLVVNYTFPLTAEDYVHRIGRTGRAGQTGLAITLFTEHDKAQAGALTNVLKAAHQNVPEELLRFGGTVKKKGHDLYGAFTKDGMQGQTGTKITFD